MSFTPTNKGTNQFADTSNINECLLSVKGKRNKIRKVYVRPFYDGMSVCHIIH